MFAGLLGLFSLDVQNTSLTKFCLSQWSHVSNKCYLLYRSAAFVLLAACLAKVMWMSTWYGVGLRFEMISLSLWCMLVTVADSAIQLFTCWLCHQSYQKPGGNIGKSKKTNCDIHKSINFDEEPAFGWLSVVCSTQWILVNVSHTFQLFVLTFFCLFIAPLGALSVAFNTYSILLHVVPALYVLIDLAIHRLPRSMGHAVYPVTFGLTYLLFTWLYYLAGGLNAFGTATLYPILDWQQPRVTVVFALLAICTITFIHWLTTLIVRWRIAVWNRYFSTADTVEYLQLAAV